MIFVTNDYGRQNAFTFIELLIVIIIIGILTAVSLPRFKKTFNTLQLNGFAQDLQSAMNYLHNRSVVEGKLIYLCIDDSKKEYWAQEKDSQNRLSAAQTALQSKQISRKSFFIQTGGLIK